MMLHIVTAENRERYRDQVEESYRIRHKIYVETRGWKNLEREDKREIDQFDNENAIYLLALDEEDGRVVGGSRLVPTLCPHLMSDVFPQLASMRTLPRATDIFEWTRYYVVPEKRESHAVCNVASVIMCGVQEYCLDEGVSTLSIVTEPFWIPRFLELGWNPRSLGLPVDIEGEAVIGITVDISEEALAQTREMRGIDHPVLIREGISQPAISPLSLLAGAQDLLIH